MEEPGAVMYIIISLYLKRLILTVSFSITLCGYRPYLVNIICTFIELCFYQSLMKKFVFVFVEGDHFWWGGGGGARWCILLNNRFTFHCYHEKCITDSHQPDMLI